MNQRVEVRFTELKEYVQTELSRHIMIPVSKMTLDVPEVESVMTQFKTIISLIETQSSEMQVNQARAELVMLFIVLDQLLRDYQSDTPKYYKLKFDLHHAFNAAITEAYVNQTTLDEKDSRIKELEARVKQLEEKLHNIENS